MSEYDKAFQVPKWLSLQFSNFGPYEVVRAANIRYVLRSLHGSFLRQAIHSLRLQVLRQAEHLRYKKK